MALSTRHAALPQVLLSLLSSSQGPGVLFFHFLPGCFLFPFSPLSLECKGGPHNHYAGKKKKKQLYIAPSGIALSSSKMFNSGVNFEAVSVIFYLLYKGKNYQSVNYCASCHRAPRVGWDSWLTLLGMISRISCVDQCAKM